MKKDKIITIRVSEKEKKKLIEKSEVAKLSLAISLFSINFFFSFSLTLIVIILSFFNLSSPFHKRVWDIPNYQDPFVYTKGNLAKNISFILVLLLKNNVKRKVTFLSATNHFTSKVI